MRHTGRGVKHIVVLSRFQFFTFKTLRARSTLEEWGDKACIASLFLSPLLSRSLLPTLSPVRVFPSHKGSQQPFFLIRQRRHCIFPTTLSTRVNNNARKKHAREHCYLATPSFLLSLFSFFFFYNIIKAAQLYVRYADILHQAPYCLPSPFFLEILLVLVPLFNEVPRFVINLFILLLLILFILIYIILLYNIIYL